jgi:AAA ATPase domain
MRGGPTAIGLPGGQLRGRQREREALDRLLASARAADGAVLVVYGEPGVGKTALVEYAVESAHGFRVAQALGVEGEMELPFAALQQMCASFIEFTEHLPLPQREALAVAFGLSEGPAASPFFVGLAVLGLMSEAAAEHPLLCVVDDAQWLDRASARALTFVARRLLAEKIALVLATRSPVYRSSTSSHWGVVMRGRCWSQSSPPRWMIECWNGSLPRRAGTRSP